MTNPNEVQQTPYSIVGYPFIADSVQPHPGCETLIPVPVDEIDGYSN